VIFHGFAVIIIQRYDNVAEKAGAINCGGASAGHKYFRSIEKNGMAREEKVTKSLINHGITEPRKSLTMWLMTFAGLAVLFAVIVSLPALMISGLCAPILITGFTILVLIIVIFAAMHRKPRA